MHPLLGVQMKNRMVMVVFSLVEENHGKTNRELEEEISKELSTKWIPWCKALETVKVIDE